MPKILILTHQDERHFYFVNKIIEKNGLDTKVFLNGKTINLTKLDRVKKKITKPFFLWEYLIELLLSADPLLAQ